MIQKCSPDFYWTFKVLVPPKIPVQGKPFPWGFGLFRGKLRASGVTAGYFGTIGLPTWPGGPFLIFNPGKGPKGWFPPGNFPEGLEEPF